MGDLDRFARFCETHLTLEDGSPLIVEDFQRRMLTDFFAGCTETVILISKKNGKSTLIAALAIFELVTTPDAECVVVAASREQALILFRQAAGFVRRSDWLKERVVSSMRELRSRSDTGRIRVLAADVDTADGVIPTLAVADELARHKSAELYGVMRDGLGPRRGRLIGISTAGDDHDSPLGKLRTAAHRLPDTAREGAYRYCRSKDRAFVLHEWALDDTDDVEDMSVVKGANPASWQTERALRRRWDSPSTLSWQWRRFACGQWVVGEDSAIAAGEWAACARVGVEIAVGARGVVVGCDLGLKWDSTALTPVWKDPDTGKVRLHRPTILVPPQTGESLDIEDVVAACEQYAERWPTLTFVLDPEAGGDLLAQRLSRAQTGRVMTHSQKSAPMCRASQLLAEKVAAGELEHPDDEHLTRHVLAAAARFVGAAWRFDKRQGKGKGLPIDAVVALAMAVRVLEAAPPATSTAPPVAHRPTVVFG